MDQEILNELKSINVKLERLDGIENAVKAMQKDMSAMKKDISNINEHIEKGIYVDLERVKEPVAKLEQKII